MPTGEFPEGKYLIPRSELVEHVSIASLQAISAQLPGLETWQQATVRKQPTSIFDINGKLLFLDYPVVRGNEVVGRVRGAASRVLGNPVISLVREYGTWDYNKSVEKLNIRIQKEYPNWKVLSTKLVCYSYPKLGVMYNLTSAGRKSVRLIFDVASLNLIPEATPKSGDREGALAWSYYDSLKDEQRAVNLDHYKEVDRPRLQISADTRKVIIATRKLVDLNKLVVGQVMPWQTTTRELQFCTHYLHTETRSHHCFSLHGQQRDDYCAVATCQMILCYYRYYYTQDQIAPSLNYSDAANGCPPDTTAGYENLSNNHIDATYDSSPTWGEAKSQIDGLHPFKSGVPHHARACAGYSFTSWLGIATSKKLYIYDPWPWDTDFKVAGAIYWEEYDSDKLTNFQYTRLDY